MIYGDDSGVKHAPEVSAVNGLVKTAQPRSQGTLDTVELPADKPAQADKKAPIPPQAQAKSLLSTFIGVMAK